MDTADDGGKPLTPNELAGTKGAQPAVAIGIWSTLHASAGVLLVAHGSLSAAGAAQRDAYVLSTLLAGTLYARLVLSDPGYVDEVGIRAELAVVRARQALSASAPAPDVARSAAVASPAGCETSALLAPDVECASAPASAPVGALATDAELATLFSGECAACGLPRPLRSRHCRHCRRCVWRYDHHCFLVANCVGEGNHALFWWFLLAQAVSIWCSIPLVHGAMRDDPIFAAWLAHTGPLFGCTLLLWPMGVLVTLLLVVHTLMALVDTTSYESAKHDQLEYLRDVPECTFPFADALPCIALARFCAGPRAGHGGTLVPRPAPFRTWKGTFWRNRYYSCC
ncbi:hypothetical protein KFE25_003370 [Diacronema lutheri]|uniref:Palmitoyltransferase n=1 Tax=Diacronema lutheri TaxID=2081491 RepID=A0A8J5XHU6_DIALT|nr:hypothetical protein KFE25_003370 [Diacronema lutheri]